MWLSDLRVVLPDEVLERGSLRIENGQIAEIIDGPAPDPTVSAPGLIAIPGLVDLHGDMLERDIQPRPGALFPVALALFELDKRLAGAGVTTAYAAVSFAWKQDDLRSMEKAAEIIDTIHHQRDNLLVDFFVHARFEINNPETGPVLAELLDKGRVHLVSVMDHTPGQGQYSNIDKYVNFMAKWLGVDPNFIEENALVRMKDAIKTAADTPRNWDGVRGVIEVAEAREIPVASHDDDTIEKIDRVADLGVTISEFPVTLIAAEEARRRGMHVIMGAPNAYRGESNTGNLSALEAIKAGLVDILATDYFPAAPLHSAFKLVRDGVLPLHESVKLVSKNPAEAMDLRDRGVIEVGRRADIVLVQEDVHPRVRATLRSGVPVYWDNYMAQLAPTI
ncbi:MAG: alpha-D-ribose 1-methylphosphonate 5-triphosphate diphosphatase [Chloroflexi bacterium]|nr:alpha-D-ribose 1-methylphosphonate 5-triphosphate diphosphatase [Chloroflexota bacterium]